MAPRLRSSEPEINTFLQRYSPSVETQLRDARARLRARFPRGFELVFDNYNALVFGYSATDRPRDALISVAGYPRWVTLFFVRGVGLHDPGCLLEGEGKQVRSIRLKQPTDLDAPGVQDLICQARQPHDESFRLAPPFRTVVKMAVAQPRARRPV